MRVHSMGCCRVVFCATLAVLPVHIAENVTGISADWDGLTPPSSNDLAYSADLPYVARNETEVQQEDVGATRNSSSSSLLRGVFTGGIPAKGSVSCTVIAAFALSAIAALVCLGGAEFELDARDSSTKDVTEVSRLLDHAKVLSVFLLVFKQFLELGVGLHPTPTNLEVYVGPDAVTWLSGADPLIESLVTAINTIQTPLVCFVSGVCSQGSMTGERMQRYITMLVMPTFLWVFFVKPVIVTALVDLRFQSLVDGLWSFWRLEAFQAEWYLQALCLWRGSVFLLWTHLRPQVALAIMLAVSCAGGYYDLDAALGVGHFNLMVGCMPYFAVGYVFPCRRTSHILRPESPLVNILAAALVACLCFWSASSSFQDLLPSVSGPYFAGGLKPETLPESEYNLWWTRRITKLALDIVPSVLTVFLVLPRTETALTWMGRHTLYPYLFSIIFLAWRSKLLMVLPLPVVTSGLGHVFILLLHVLYAAVVFAGFCSSPARWLLSWCVRPTWASRFLFKAKTDGMFVYAADTQSGVADSKRTLEFAGVNEDEHVRSAILKPAQFRPSVASSAPLLQQRSIPRAASGEPDSDEDPTSVPTWAFGAPIPWMAQAREFYHLILPVFFAYSCMNVALPIGMWLLLQRFCMTVVGSLPNWLLYIGIATQFFPTPMKYIYHYFRLRDSLEVPKPSPNARSQPALLHAVVIVAYKEPLAVLRLTLQSIVAQKAIGRPPIVLLAMEARDPTRHECVEALREQFGSQVDRLIMTEHTLLPGEQIGKSSNENKGLRDMYQQLIEEERMNAFQIMVTIVDADSVLSDTYLTQVETSFYAQPDGRRLIYSGPLNTYRNFGGACMLSQTYELMRCHQDVFFNPILQYYPQSNYSLMLGFIAEIDFWTPDNMPEDIHTAAKAMLLNFGSLTTVPVVPFICNDLVEGFGDRYVQAKRHQWGITEFAWQLAIWKYMDLPFHGWISYFKHEFAREGSYFASARGLSGWFVKAFAYWTIWRSWPFLPWNAQLIIYSMVASMAWDQLWFFAAECWIWRALLSQFDIEHASFCNWVGLVVFSPFLMTVATISFYILPTLDCIFHVHFIGELSYVCAPKGEDQRKDTA